MNRAQWMAALPGATKLFDVLLPGTHDTMAWQSDTLLSAQFWKTQSSTIEQQLQSGIRFFDLRPRDFGNNTYPMHHGRIFLKTYLENDALPKIEEFLEKNKSETVIISLKPEYKPEKENGSNFALDLLEQRLTSDKYFTTYKHFENAQKETGLTLTTKNPKGEEPSKNKLNYNLPIDLLRGKILVIFRDGPFSSPEKTKSSYRSKETLFTGFDALTPPGEKSWGDNESYRRVQSNYSNDVLIQDMYGKINSTRFGSKTRVMENFWYEAHDEKDNESMLWFNAANRAYEFNKQGPQYYANEVNADLSRILDPNNKAFFDVEWAVRGIISMDFVGDHQGTVDSIINYNNHHKELTSGNDFKFGSANDDVFKDPGGSDIIFAGKGDDILYSYSGYDLLHGNKGNDLFIGQSNVKNKKIGFNPDSTTRMLGDTGNDVFTVSEGIFDIDGGAGIDSLRVILTDDYHLKKKGKNYILTANTGSLHVRLKAVEHLELFDAENTTTSQIGILSPDARELAKFRQESKTLPTDPIRFKQGEFLRQQNISLIEPNRYALQPQLKWYSGNACFPTAVTNALAGLASYYSIPELLKKGATKHDQLLNTLEAIGKSVKTTDGGTNPETMIPGLNEYLSQQDLAGDFEVVNIFGEQGMKPIDNKKFSLRTRPSNNYTITNELISAFARGVVIFSNAWIQKDGSFKRGHVVTGIDLQFDDKNDNMIIDRGEAHVSIIDPMDPASSYSPMSINIESADNKNEVEQLFNTTVQAAEGATPNLRKVEIYQNDFGLAFDYQESGIDYLENAKKNTIEVEVKSSKQQSSGQFFSATSIRKSIYTGEVDDKIDFRDDLTSQSSKIIYDFGEYIKDDQVSADIFSYFNEESSLANNIGFYQILDQKGTIKDPISGQLYTPSDSDYIDKALKLSEIFSKSASTPNQSNMTNRISEDHAQMGSISFKLSTINNNIMISPIVQTSQGNTFTSFAEANSDKLNHFVKRGDMSFGFEDQLGLGDRDFNDLQVMMTPLSINGMS